jgi:hypothetical protein
LAVAGMSLGILPPVLIGPLYFVYHLWIAPQQQFWSGLGAFYVLGPGVLVALAAIICGYIGIKHWPRYPSENLIWFNLSLALGVVWAGFFWVIVGTGLYLGAG